MEVLVGDDGGVVNCSADIVVVVVSWFRELSVPFVA